MRILSIALILIIIFISSIQAQEMRIAELQEDGTISVEKLQLQESPVYTRSTFSQLPNFPFTAPTHPSFKNFRNVTIADLDNDGRKEIVVCLNETLYALASNGSIKWLYTLSGTSNFPPAIADIDGDGDLEISVQTYGIPAVGNVYLFDHNGNLQNGWPINMDNHFFFNGITFADLDGQNPLEIIACERINSNSGRVHALKLEGTSFNSNWPISIPGTPAFTPSVADIDNNGINDLVTSTTTALYAFDAHGDLLNGFPLKEEGTKFSYQSPLLADLNQDSKIEIIGARHGDLPGTIVVDNEGSYFENWPDYDNIWTFATPAVVDIDGDDDYEVFYSRPYFSETQQGSILIGYDHNGQILDGYPITGLAGSEGLIAVADIDNDGDFEIITSSKATIDGKGFIHAYHFETQQEVENFPIRVEGFTLLNGAYLSDVDNDGLLDLTALSYELKFDPSSHDSGFINVFNLEVPYDESTILFNGYKGSNTHDGRIFKLSSSTDELNPIGFSISPNPVQDLIKLEGYEKLIGQSYQIYNVEGKIISAGMITSQTIETKGQKVGIHFLKIGNATQKFIKI